MIILDATMRDGGYYPMWCFELDLVNKYLKSMEQSRINAVEIGFRNPDKPEGSFANVTDKFIIEKLYKPKIEYFGVMINATTSTKEIIKKTFSNSNDSPINFVRVAIHFMDVKNDNIFYELKKLGYLTTCNLMQAADKSYEEIKEVSKLIKSWGTVDVLYLADSLGGMNHDSVRYSFDAIREGWGDGLTGFHGHNNKGTALDNSLEALDVGVKFLDGTICGMGRGPGNTETEYLLYELNKRGVGEFVLKPIYDLVINQFKDLHDKYKWGPSLFYYLAAEGNIHPTFIQTMLSENYEPDRILNAILYLENIESSFFNKELLKEATNV